jgi:GT2 family glycosyltransferase
MKLNLSICVVTYNCEAFIERFHLELLASLAGHMDWELLYFDNSPTLATANILLAADHPGHQVFHEGINRGFSYANNRLIEKSRYAFVLLLNPDVFGFTAQFWSDLMGRATPDSVRFIRLLNEDGSFQDCVGRISSLGRPFEKSPDYAALCEPAAVETGIMAFMLAPREMFKRVGPLDETFPLYGEDMDWCYRAGLQHVPLVYDPALALTHVGGASADTRWSRNATRLQKYSAERTFINKHYRGWYRIAMLALNRVKRLRAAL